MGNRCAGQVVRVQDLLLKTFCLAELLCPIPKACHANVHSYQIEFLSAASNHKILLLVDYVQEPWSRAPIVVNHCRMRWFACCPQIFSYSCACWSCCAASWTGYLLIVCWPCQSAICFSASCCCPVHCCCNMLRRQWLPHTAARRCYSRQLTGSGTLQ